MTRRKGDNICKCGFRQRQTQRWGEGGGGEPVLCEAGARWVWRCGGGGGGWISKFITDLGNCRRKKGSFLGGLRFLIWPLIVGAGCLRLRAHACSCSWPLFCGAEGIRFELLISNFCSFFIFFCWNERHAPASLMTLRLMLGGCVSRCFGADVSTSQLSISTGAFFRDIRAEESDQYAAPQSIHQSPCGL